MKELVLADHLCLVENLKKSLAQQGKAELIETHISSVIVTDSWVYKLKKPVNLGFLDFSSLDKRHFYCDEEIRLNKRLSPGLYLDVLPISGSIQYPEINGPGQAIDYLVRMRPFAQQNQLDRLLQRHELDPRQMSEFARYIAEFHLSAAMAPDNSHFGTADAILQPVLQNFSQIRERMSGEDQLERLAVLEAWSQHTFDELKGIFEQRKQQGFIRECHGDLHLRNLAWSDDKPLAFDCIEFEPNFYFIDVINDIAFLIMDLIHQQRHDLARLFLNRYLEVTGDYEGIRVLSFYMVYRALVRAKIDIITATQQGIEDSQAEKYLSSFHHYLELALTLTKKQRPRLSIMFGPSGSGKSTVARQISKLTDAIVLRSDVERKRLYADDLEQDKSADYGQGIYSAQATQKTYQRLMQLAETVLAAGLSVIVDATFSDPQQRTMFQNLATKMDCDYRIIELKVSEQVMRQRIIDRKNDVSDADVEILNKQLEQWQGLTQLEQRYQIIADVENRMNATQLSDLLSI